MAYLHELESIRDFPKITSALPLACLRLLSLWIICWLAIKKKTPSQPAREKHSSRCQGFLERKKMHLAPLSLHVRPPFIASSHCQLWKFLITFLYNSVASDLINSFSENAGNATKNVLGKRWSAEQCNWIVSRTWEKDERVSPGWCGFGIARCVWLVPVRWEDDGTESEECSSKSY